jgi:Carbohydrate esterase, sialic acid-specific acetylesterase
VILALGQSNAANFGPRASSIRSRPAVVNFFDGSCYAAEDPLLGADGEGASVWTLVGDRLIAVGDFDHVVLATFALASTSIEAWTQQQYFSRRLARIVGDLKASRLEPTMIFWFQGEADNQARTTANDYARRFETLSRAIRARGLVAPIYVSRTSICQIPASAELRVAHEKVLRIDGVKAGPDTDALGYESRWDGCHFSDEGLERLARLWVDAVRAH